MCGQPDLTAGTITGLPGTMGGPPAAAAPATATPAAQPDQPVSSVFKTVGQQTTPSIDQSLAPAQPDTSAAPQTVGQSPYYAPQSQPKPSATGAQIASGNGSAVFG